MCKKLTCLTLIALILCLTAGASAELLVHWRLDGGSGTTAADTSGNGRDGTFTGEPEWVPGHNSAGALHFDGVDDFAVHSLGQDQTFATFSVAFWVKADTLGQPNFAAAFSSYFPNTSGFQMDVDGGSPGNYRLNPNAAAGRTVFGAATLDWTHLTLTADGTSANLYYNGTWASSVTLVDNDLVFNQFAIGVNRNRNWWFACTIDDLRVYDHILSEAEIMGAMEGKPWPFAFGPNPEDGFMLEAAWANISWQPGQLAVSHDVYLGESFEDVDAGAEGTFVGNQSAPNLVVGFPGFPVPEGLVPGTTYYWRIDEVNEADPNSPWKGDVWSFWIPPKKAYSANPADGVGFVQADATVSWTLGFGGKLSHVYFGRDSAEVEAGTGDTYKGPVVDAFYEPGLLQNGTTYYWRVDQFDGVATHKGDVWSFTILPDVAVTDPTLLGWWTLDEGEGTTVVDWSGHGGHGSFVGEPKWVDGFQGTALEFSGSGQYVDCGDEAGSGVTADFTLAAWVKMAPGNAGQYLGIAGKLRNVGGYNGFGLVRYNSNVFRLWVSDGDTAAINGMASSDVLYTDTDWHHVTGVREGRNNILYVDGVRQAAGNATDFVPSPDFFHIGRQYSHLDDRYFNGRIDDVRVYNKVLTDAQIAEVMSGDTKMAGSPVPGRDALLDIRDISSLSWSRGNTAASHDVYFGTGRDAVAGADNTAPEFRGNQAGTSLSLASLVEFGGGDYYWRVDEVEADGTVNAGTIWMFTVPDHLIVDNFESYNNIDPPATGSNRIFDKWIDGFGTTTNGALVGNDLPPYAEQSIVLSGNQSMIYAYDNAGKTSEATLTPAKRDWTGEGVTKLSLSFRGISANAADRVYVALNGTAVVYHDDPAATQITGWNEWVIDLTAFGAGLTNVNSISIGVGTKNAPSPSGGAGTIYFDDIRLIR